jgi:phospholipid/cholesterol/gamma-HCH transport system substrate-binding protein
VNNTKWIETAVGLFIIAVVASMLLLAFKVSNFSRVSQKQSYEVSAEFDNVGDLKPRAAVTIAGVKVGQVDRIALNPTTYKAIVTLRINNTSNNIPADSSANIVTAGILGANYVAISPGFEEQFLHNGDTITDTHPAIILEDMLGQLIFSMKGDDKAKTDDEATKG